jgi:hypothetical protein
MRAGQPCVSVNGNALSAWAFDAMNVLSWTDATGASAWLQLMVLPGGPVFMGTLTQPDAEAAPGARTPVFCYVTSPPGNHARETQYQ